MITTGPINATGVYQINAGRATRRDNGTVIIINPDGAHTYTVGVIADDGETFVAYSGGVITADGNFCHGVGANIAVQVGGTVTPGDDLLIGYCG